VVSGPSNRSTLALVQLASCERCEGKRCSCDLPVHAGETHPMALKFRQPRPDQIAKLGARTSISSSARYRHV
jgi:hypothetical protein